MFVKQFEDKIGVGISGFKRLVMVVCSNMEMKDVILGCEECNWVKRQKISEGKEWIVIGFIIFLVEEDECWWVKKGLLKVVENIIKLEFFVKFIFK